MNENIKYILLGIGFIVLCIVGHWLMPKDQIVISNDMTMPKEDEIYVDIEGCVHSPGLLTVPYGTRVYELIEKAGGETDEADLTRVNLASIVNDEQKIVIPAKIIESEPGESAESFLVNINTASLERLKTLTGVGEGTAKKILQYREKNGYFNTIEELMDVSGIGQSKFDGLKDEITI